MLSRDTPPVEFVLIPSRSDYDHNHNLSAYNVTHPFNTTPRNINIPYFPEVYALPEPLINPASTTNQEKPSWVGYQESSQRTTICSNIPERSLLEEIYSDSEETNFQPEVHCYCEPYNQTNSLGVQLSKNWSPPPAEMSDINHTFDRSNHSEPSRDAIYHRSSSNALPASAITASGTITFPTTLKDTPQFVHYETSGNDNFEIHSPDSWSRHSVPIMISGRLRGVSPDWPQNSNDGRTLQNDALEVSSHSISNVAFGQDAPTFPVCTRQSPRPHITSNRSMPDLRQKRTSKRPLTPISASSSLREGDLSPLSSKQKKKKTKMHNCKICGKLFPRPSGLKTHMNSHNNAKPYPCNYPGCHRTFGVRSNAKRHLRTHGVLPTPVSPTGNADILYAPEYISPAVVPAPNAAMSSDPETQHDKKYPTIPKPHYIPLSLLPRTNISRLRPVSEDGSISDDDEDDEDENGDADLISNIITIPLLTVVPSYNSALSPSEENSVEFIPFEERNTYAPSGSHPYHPSQFCGLPGPITILGSGAFH